MIEPSSSLEESNLMEEVGLSDEASVTSSATGVVIRPSEDVEVSKPFTLQIPAPTLALGLTDQNKKLVVLYRKWISGSIVSGVLPYSEITLNSSGLVEFEIQAFGAYQAAYLSIEIEEEKTAESTEPIRNEDNVSVVTETGIVEEDNVVAVTEKEKASFSSVSLTANTDRTITLAATSTDTTLSSCYAEFRSDTSVVEVKLAPTLFRLYRIRL